MTVDLASSRMGSWKRIEQRECDKIGIVILAPMGQRATIFLDWCTGIEQHRHFIYKLCFLVSNENPKLHQKLLPSLTCLMIAPFGWKPNPRSRWKRAGSNG